MDQRHELTSNNASQTSFNIFVKTTRVNEECIFLFREIPTACITSHPPPSPTEIFKNIFSLVLAKTFALAVLSV